MKKLYILRHSKAGHSNKKILDDHERDLTDKGIDLCSYIGSHLKENSHEVDTILCSTSNRTKQTAEYTTEAYGRDVDINFESTLYLATPETILNELYALDDSINSAMVIGHNPGLHQLSILLSGSGDKKKFREMRSNFPPPSLVIFEIDSDKWSDVRIQSGKLIDFVTGKDLKSQKG